MAIMYKMNDGGRFGLDMDRQNDMATAELWSLEADDREMAADFDGRGAGSLATMTDAELATELRGLDDLLDGEDFATYSKAWRDELFSAWGSVRAEMDRRGL